EVFRCALKILSLGNYEPRLILPKLPQGMASIANQTTAPKGNRRKPNNLLKLSRSPIIGRAAIVNHFNRTVDALAPTTRFPRLKAFLSANIWPWICSYLKYVFERKFPFPTYAPGVKNGVYRIAPAAGAETISIS